MKEVCIWIILYAVYWYISAILGNVLWDLTQISWINDAARMFLPFIFLGITYVILKLKNKIKGNNRAVKVSDNRFIGNSLKILGIVLAGFLCAIILVMIYGYILLAVG